MGKKIVIIIGAILLVDQIIKVWVKTSMGAFESIPVIDGFFQLYYIENRGMAFGATLGGGAWAKYTLSIFRIVAIIGIAIYMRKLLKENQAPRGLLIALSLIFAGAAGNLIDSLCYDLIWSVDPNLPWNLAIGSDGMFEFDPETMEPLIRPNGFLLGSVVDMFQFTTTWPSWTPEIDFLGIRPGNEIFGAIWNFADLSISVGVGLIILNYRKFFNKEEKTLVSEGVATDESE
ncbi:signal peptidase II [Crocinitomix algicola]|uniref:signal peptidase II n=1 Tax=Crocinitomix algicola TaxID=1740263 RepID=UPI00083475CC|nr:signal peptidase II [Crocinitomix algicola]